jgi:branched-chain amino acid transport system substrate-binding protein
MRRLGEARGRTLAGIDARGPGRCAELRSGPTGCSSERPSTKGPTVTRVSTYRDVAVRGFRANNSPMRCKKGKSARRATVAAVAIVGVVSLSACSSSASKAGAGSSSGSDSGGTIKVFSIAQLQATGFALPDIETGLKAAAKAINAAGGINGKQVSVTVCNDGGNVNQATACAREAVTGKYAAIVGGVSLYYNSIFPVIEPAGIPVIGEAPLNTAAQTSPLSFPLDSSPANYVVQGISLVKDKGCKNVAIIGTDEATTQTSASQLALGVTYAGGQVVKNVAISASTPDFAPSVSTALAAGADCFGTALGAASIPKAVSAIRESAKPNAPIGAPLASVPASILAALGSSASDIIATNNAYTSDSPVWATAVVNMKKEDSSVSLEPYGPEAYSAMYVFAEIAKQISGPITPAAITAETSKQSAVKALGYPEAIDFSKPGPSATAPRLFNASVLVYSITNAKFTLTSSTPIDATPALTQK